MQQELRKQFNSQFTENMRNILRIEALHPGALISGTRKPCICSERFYRQNAACLVRISLM